MSSIIISVCTVPVSVLQEHPGAPVYRKRGTLADWRSGGWECIGTLGTEGRDAEKPEDDIQEKWAFLLSDKALLLPGTSVDV